MAKQEADRRFASELHRFLPVLVDLGHVDVGNEIVRIGARENDYADGLVRLGELNQSDQIENVLGPSRFIGGAASAAKTTPASRYTLIVSKSMELASMPGAHSTMRCSTVSVRSREKRSVHVHADCFNAVLSIGSLRTRLPVAAKTALATAGTTHEVPASPIPPGGSVLATMCTSTVGASFMRSTR